MIERGIAVGGEVASRGSASSPALARRAGRRFGWLPGDQGAVAAAGAADVDDGPVRVRPPAAPAGAIPAPGSSPRKPGLTSVRRCATTWPSNPSRPPSSASCRPLARDVFHGQRGQLRKHYQVGQENQLDSLGIMVNVIVLWQTVCTQAALEHLAASGYPPDPADVARLTPLGHPTINLDGRYRTISRPPTTGLRPLRTDLLRILYRSSSQAMSAAQASSTRRALCSSSRTTAAVRSARPWATPRPLRERSWGGVLGGFSRDFAFGSSDSGSIPQSKPS